MANLISAVTIGSVVDKSLVVDRYTVAALMSIGNSWTKLRLILRAAYADVTPPTNAGFGFGVASGITAGNGWVTGGLVPHLVCYDCETPTRNAGPPSNYAFATPIIFKRILGAVTTGSGPDVARNISSAPATIRNAFIVQIEKGTPNYTFRISGPSSSALAQAHVTYDQVFTAHNTLNLTSAAAVLGYNAPQALTIAVSEANGNLDQIVFYALRSGLNFHVSDFTYSVQP